MRRLVLLLAAAALAGCSQIDAVAPVGGNTLAEVRFAAVDVLLDADVELLTVPVCEQQPSGAISCSGTTLADEPVEVRSPGGRPATMTVSVGGRELYSGSVGDVLDAAADGTSS